CIYSNIVIGDIMSEDTGEILEKLQTYWHITKDKVEKCKDCELRYVCFDCREIPSRKSGDLYSVNPICKYDPYNGTWNG
ncbi:MAG: grasp-with-spasm system SPASM domain peptide maturase, partial [bacterium]|nr:grasp-with-spasm system SPASM domain peptide maturase [bacterium]